MQLKTLPIFLAFFLMGLADAMGPMSDAVKDHYVVSNVISRLLPFAVFIAFAVFSVPGGVLAARVGKKNLLLLGLGLNAAALVIPSIMLPTYPVLLACIFCLGIGTTFLQVAGNPIMRDVSAAGNYSRNLAFAQGVKGLGSSGSAYFMTAITGIAFFESIWGWRAGFPVFCGLMIVAFLAVASLKVDETKADIPASIGSSLGLLREPVFFLAVLGIFLYVGAEVCMATYLKPLLHESFGFEEKTAAFFGPAAFLFILAVGRLLGGSLLTIMTPRTCFRLSALLGVIGAAAVMTGNKYATYAGIVAAGLGFANIWPMLFSITVEERPKCANELSGLMCMAISGGAVMPLIMAKLVDMNYSLAMTFAVPTACFAFLLLLSLRSASKSSAQGAAA
jgi:FHS family L-fucose permease-like MFS transporter